MPKLWRRRRGADASKDHTSPATPHPEGSCRVCGAGALERRTVSFRNSGERPRDVAVCPGCGYVAIAELDADRYRGKTSLDQLPKVGERAGTMDRPGREFQMARMALDILRRPTADVLVYGPGRSMDNHHIRTLANVGHVAIGDIMNVRDDMEFHDANLPAQRQFDVVVASEVVEHFRDPLRNFAQLFQFVDEDGLLVCGTSLRGRGPLAGQKYVFYPDHTSLYSPESLQLIARDNGFFVDFRPMSKLGARKRYVFLTRSDAVVSGLVRYFGYHAMGPSERDLDSTDER